MDTTATFIPYQQTGWFSKIVTDYIAEDKKLQPFYNHAVSLDGIKAAIEQRKLFKTDRSLLSTILAEQYTNTPLTDKQKENIDKLASENTFTICTAHQPNIFTGPLYFIYKILHAVKLAEELQSALPENNFVPVYYMGSEDADLDELGHIFINGEKYEWVTSQTGAVGRMKVDKALVQLLELISGQLLVHPFGAEIIDLVKSYYQLNTTIEKATFKLVNALFARFGLLILLPDSPLVKRAFVPVIKKELTEAFSHPAVQETVTQFPEEYKVQASGRAINLFYLIDDKRERIEQEGENFLVVNTSLKFSKKEIMQELEDHPERFSPNVILRPVLQESILPGIAFIGGGGEIAYWLELKKVFEAVQVPYPMLVVRNSFMLADKASQVSADKLKFTLAQLFASGLQLMNELVKRDSNVQLDLEKEKQQLIDLYQHMQATAGGIDATLQTHTNVLQTQAIKKIEALEKKMFRAQKRKFEAQQRQLNKLKANLFPHNNLQERVDNLMPYYAATGKEFIDMIYKHSKGLDQQFGILHQL